LNKDYKIILNQHIDSKSKIGIQLKKYQNERILLPDANKLDIWLLSKHRKKHGFE